MSKRLTQKTFEGFEEQAAPVPRDAAATANSRAAADGPQESFPPPAGAKPVPGRIETGSAKLAELAIDLTGKSVYVIDAHSLIFQVFHAIPEMTGPAGQPVNAIFGFLRDILQLVRNQAPDYLFCAFDLPGKTFRHQLYEGYKASREEMPEDLSPQIGHVQRLLEALQIPVLTAEGFEADDVLGTMAALVERLHGECVLVTNDKDCRQLITDHVCLFNIRKNEFLDTAALAAEWGIRPDQVVDYQALVGDPIDCVPGIPLIGPKLARQLITQYETLESVLDHAQDVGGVKRRESILQHREQALKSRELVRLASDVPLCVDWTQAQVGLDDPTAALKLCEEFGFRSLADQVAKWAGAAASADTGTAWQTNYRTVTTPAQLSRVGWYAAHIRPLRAGHRDHQSGCASGPVGRHFDLLGYR